MASNVYAVDFPCYRQLFSTCQCFPENLEKCNNFLVSSACNGRHGLPVLATTCNAPELDQRGFPVAGQIMTLCCGTNGSRIVFKGGGWNGQTGYLGACGGDDECKDLLSMCNEQGNNHQRLYGNVNCPDGSPSDILPATFPYFFGSNNIEQSATGAVIEETPAPAPETTPTPTPNPQPAQTIKVFNVSNPATNTAVAIQTPVPVSNAPSVLTAEEKKAMIEAKIEEIQEMIIKLMKELIEVLSQK